MTGRVLYQGVVATTFLSAAVLMFCIGVRAGTDLPRTAVFVYVVNSTGDGSDAFPGDGNCETVQGNGVCTLRAAIQEALHGQVGAKFISFNIPGSDPNCFPTFCQIPLSSALPDLSISITINGP